jgi:digeranylgeranylglycerophospholipid reductase
MRGMTLPSETVDVLVVGLGPAGSSAARVAALAGARVLAVDRKRQAGVPVQCAEFVPQLLGQDSSTLAMSHAQSISAMTTFVAEACPHTKDQFPGHMIDRTVFDAALVERARAAGARCEFGAAFRNIDADGISVLSDGRKVRSRVVIGADGPHSVVGRAVGRANVDLVETRQISVPLLQPFEATDIFLSADIPGGYGWLFPKKNVANLGVGVAPRWRSQLKPLLDRLHARLIAEQRVGPDVLFHTGGAIPVGGMIGPVAAMGASEILLAGDAAGLTNPVTGAGINAAIQSGELAGRAAARAIAGFADAATTYAEDLDDLLKPSLDRALRRRSELLDIHNVGRKPSTTELQRGWIAFPEYWAA